MCWLTHRPSYQDQNGTGDGLCGLIVICAMPANRAPEPLPRPPFKRRTVVAYCGQRLMWKTCPARQPQSKAWKTRLLALWSGSRYRALRLAQQLWKQAKTFAPSSAFPNRSIQRYLTLFSTAQSRVATDARCHCCTIRRKKAAFRRPLQSSSREKIGSLSRIRTYDQVINSHLLYR